MLGSIKESSIIIIKKCKFQTKNLPQKLHKNVTRMFYVQIDGLV